MFQSCLVDPLVMGHAPSTASVLHACQEKAAVCRSCTIQTMEKEEDNNKRQRVKRDGMLISSHMISPPFSTSAVTIVHRNACSVNECRVIGLSRPK